ncbi:Mss4-like protein [Fusarium sp. MPI-SDFR-AT-0072]|nr:Mss4-like protein [Fusarium sp. MPI-SDFR-AT-0072]
MTTEQSHKAEKFVPRAGLAQDGWSAKEEATETCYCGAVQLVLITASMFTTGIVVLDTHLKHTRGEENLKQFSQSDTIERDGSAMTNFFCSTCESLMCRRSSAYAGVSVLRWGTVDDFRLVKTVPKPDVEQFCKHKVSCLKGIESLRQSLGQAKI